MSTLVSDTQSSFQSELQTKQSLLDQTHNKIRESTASLAEERRVLAELQHKSEDRKARRLRIENLRLANDRKRAILLSRANPGTKPTSIRDDIKVGEADAGLEIDTTILDDLNETFTLTPAKREYLKTLPSAAVLNARATAYRKHNARLEAEAKNLQCQSIGLENQLRKIVSLCTGVPEEKVDEMVDGLEAAIRSEGDDDVEVGRVREFLRKVEGGGVD